MNPIINRKQDILYKDLAVDLTAHRVSRAGHELLLTPREFALLAVLGIVYFFVTERILRRHLNLE